jgi:hypothetical protein
MVVLTASLGSLIEAQGVWLKDIFLTRGSSFCDASNYCKQKKARETGLLSLEGYKKLGT